MSRLGYGSDGQTWDFLNLKTREYVLKLKCAIL